MNWKQYCESFASTAKTMYYAAHHKALSLSNPRTFTEKIWWMKVYDCSLLKSYCADKINIHNYVTSKLGSDMCVPILQTCDRPSEIDWDSLPDKFVIKCNHGSGYNIVVTNKNTIDKIAIYDTLNKWLSEDYAFKYGIELQYHLIQRRILIEQYLDDIQDIKAFCFNGTPKFYEIDRHLTEHRQNYYSITWEPLPSIIRLQYPRNPKVIDQVPYELNELNHYAEILSADFKFVRVDFLVSKGKLYIGELTFTPGCGMQHFASDGDLIIGNMLNLGNPAHA